MKKLFLLAVVVCFVPTLAFSQTLPYPPAGNMVPAYYYDSTSAGWVEMEAGDLTALAQCWESYKSGGYCNKDWDIKVVIHASIAQWCSWNMNATRWDWFVKKPGDYAADCISATIASNQNILVDYHDFGDLIALDPTKAVDTTIEVWYAVGGDNPFKIDDPNWVSAENLNNVAEWDTLYDDRALHEGISFKLWNRIHVSNCNSACEYEDIAYISLKLLCQKTWIDSKTGDFIPLD